LQASGAKPLDLGRIGDQHIPTELLKPVMHQSARQSSTGRELLNDLTTSRQQADIDHPSTQIQSSMQT
jgi:hypothetical protein